MGKSTSGGNKKSSKRDQPKRKRYIAERRGFRRRLRDLEQHIENNPKDATAKASLPKVRQRVIGG